MMEDRTPVVPSEDSSEDLEESVRRLLAEAWKRTAHLRAECRKGEDYPGSLLTMILR